jgi:DNA-binding transcriptional LysR family regulator
LNELRVIHKMNFNRIDLNLFVVFDVIYAEGGITRASERLNLSQPAISHSLGRLRQLFGDPLFTRQGHAMTPTPFARRMIEPVRQALQGLELTLSHTESFDYRSARRRFSVGMRDVAEAALIPIIMRRISKRAPHVDLSVAKTERRELENDLAAGGLDVAIDVHLPLGEEIKRQRLCGEHLAVVARKRHPSVRPGLNLDTYLAQEHILVTQRRRGLSAEDYELNRQNLSRKIRLRCQHYYTACRVVSGTDLILTMPERWAPVVNAQLGNQLIAFPLNVTVFDSYIYWHAHSENDSANAWLRQQMIESFNEFTTSTERTN